MTEREAKQGHHALFMQGTVTQLMFHHGSRNRDSEPPYRGGPRRCGVGVRAWLRVGRNFGYVSSRRRWSLASISSNLVPSGSGMVRQTVLSSTSRTVIPSSTSLSMTLTVLQLTSSRAGKGWYVTFMSSFSMPGMSNLAVTLVPSGESLNSTIDRCLLNGGGAGEGTRGSEWVDGSSGRPLSGEWCIGGDLPLSSDLIFEGEAAISRSLALRTALHTRSSDSASSGVAGPDELVEAWETRGVEKGSGAMGRFRGGW